MGAALLMAAWAGLAAAQEDGACAAFTARLEAFHEAQAREYRAMGAEHLALERSLAAEAENALNLARSLERQARRARQAAVRRVLAAQAREARQAAASAQKRLKEALKAHRVAEEKFKDVYKIRARMLLEKRPAGCALKG